MRAFITGGSGFLGWHLSRELEKRGIDYVAASSREVDLTQDHALKECVEGKVDVIFHLAAWTRAGTFCRTHPGSQWLINQQLNTNVLAWWNREQPQASLVAMGTSVSYAKGLPLSEEHYLDGQPIEDFYAYAMCKRMLLIGMQMLNRQFGLRYLYVVPSTLYGPKYHTDGRQMHFIFDLIRKIIRGKELGEPVVLWGDGHQRRELVFVDDFVQALLALVEKVDNDIVNIGAGEEHSIRTFASHICRIVGYPEERIAYDTTRYVGATSKCLNVAKIRRLLPEYSPRPLEDGLRATIAWFYEAKAWQQ